MLLLESDVECASEPFEGYNEIGCQRRVVAQRLEFLGFRSSGGRICDRTLSPTTQRGWSGGPGPERAGSAAPEGGGGAMGGPKSFSASA